MLHRVIEEKRKEMILVGERYGLTSKKTVQCSQELDKLLNLLNKQTQLINIISSSRKIS